MAGQLPRTEALADFVCRGLAQVPGIAHAWHAAETELPVAAPAGVERVPVRLGAHHYGEVVLRIADPDRYRPYAPYVANLVVMLAVMLQERGQRTLQEAYQEELERRVAERTRELSEEVRERRTAEAQALAEKRRAEAYLDIAEALILELDADGRIVVLNQRGCDLLGVTPDAARGQDWFELAIAPEERDAVRAVFERAIAAAENPYEYYDSAIVDRSGARRVLAWHNIVHRVDGRVVGSLSSGIDITARQQAEADKRALEAQLRDAQKLESLGRLAGGVAHDFNNMLAVILGHAELAIRETDPDAPLYRDLEEILEAANRSSDLTRQLLAFARRQIVSPRVLDLNEAVGGMLKMLRRLIGEDIDLAWMPGARLWPVEMDPSQVDQILANLCVNARDAIADVGKITIETHRQVFDEDYCAAHANFRTGEYVKLSVSDDGCGMDKATLAQIFEPFFTTKAYGKGTGLGLAMVHGVVHQNNGFVNVYSEPGAGTTFSVYLPRYTGTAERSALDGAVEPTPTGLETILVVEDEPAILVVATKMLRLQGYTVLTARNAAEAIRVSNENAGGIDLLLTDVVMPEMNGRDLAKHVAPLHASMKVLFMSGYTANVIAHQGVLDPGTHFIQKPFSVQSLAAKVREVLDGVDDA
ncbi:MAG: response regulator [Deltaproteobacteria bacterium]|nr:MAG: response regulator [Deltaproteobacteria bacterium]